VTGADRAETDGIDLDGYCRAIEGHVCRKNDGHLIRVAGPTFDLVRGWAEQGVPLRIALAGIDRAFERYHRKGARRRPLQVSFCNDDVLDMFDDWRRALGLSGGVGGASTTESSVDASTVRHEHDLRPGSASSVSPAMSSVEHHGARGVTLPQHLERVANRLTVLRGDARNDAGMEAALARAVLEIDGHRQAARQARGAARAAIVTRLLAVEEDLLAAARAGLSPDRLERLAHEAGSALAPFRERMPRDAYDRAHQAALAQVLRQHAGLPVIRYDADR
jgi:hypothetical protein